VSDPAEPTQHSHRDDSVGGFLMFMAGLFTFLLAVMALAAIPLWTAASLWFVLPCLASPLLGMRLIARATRGTPSPRNGE
jgi:uncharacterized membrane protein HdeD (DUF308 family)